LITTKRIIANIRIEVNPVVFPQHPRSDRQNLDSANHGGSPIGVSETETHGKVNPNITALHFIPKARNGDTGILPSGRDDAGSGLFDFGHFRSLVC
jgi:hypothetical protein